MRKVLFGLSALVGLSMISGSAQARERQFLLLAWDDGRPEYAQQHVEPAYVQPQQHYYHSEPRPNLFQQMWDLEQRKNAWLRRSFFGR